MSSDSSKNVIVVIGANGLLGRRICTELDTQGAIVIAADLNIKPSESTDLNPAQPEGSSLSVQLDMVSEDSIHNMISLSLSKFGQIDAVVNVAYPRGKHYGKGLSEVTYESFCENVDVHLGGYFLVSKIFGDFFAKHKKGHVVSFASVYGLVAPRFEIYEKTGMTMPVEYAAIKAGIISLMRYFAKFYKDEGVRFNCVAPGGVLDNQPQDFVEKYSRYAGSIGMLSPENVSNVVAFLLSPGASAINGQTIIVDDGWSL